jgi:hypothetical protein
MTAGPMTRTEKGVCWSVVAYCAGFVMNTMTGLFYGAMPVYLRGVPAGMVLDPRHVTGFSIIGDYIPLGGFLMSPGDLLLYGGLIASWGFFIGWLASGQLSRRFPRGGRKTDWSRFNW